MVKLESGCSSVGRLHLFIARLCVVITVAGLYILCGHIAQLPSFHLIPGIYLFFPIAAVSILSFYFFGPIALVGMTAGAVIDSFLQHTPLSNEIVWALIHSLEGYIAYIVLNTRGSDVRLYRQKTLFYFLLIGLAGGTLCDAFLGNVYQYMRHIDSVLVEQMPLRFFAWLTSDLASVFCIALPLIFLIRPHLEKIPVHYRILFMHRKHHQYLTGTPTKTILSRKAIWTALIYYTVFFISFYLSFSNLGVDASWALMLLIFPILYLSFEGGVAAGVYTASAATFLAYIFIFSHNDPHLRDLNRVLLMENRILLEKIIPTINAIATLFLLNLLGIVGGFFKDSVRKKIEISKRIQRLTETLITARRRREILSHVSAALMDVLLLKGLTIQEEDRITRIPDDLFLSGDEETLEFIIPPYKIICYKWEFDTVRIRDKHHADQMVHQARIAVNNLELHDNLTGRIKELQVVFSIAGHLLETLDLDTLLQKVTESLRQAFSVSVSMVFIFDPSARLLRLRAFSGIEDSSFLTQEVAPGEGVVGSAFARGEVSYVPDVTKDPSYVKGIEGIQSEVAIPLKVEKESIGVLNLESYHARPFTEKDLELLKAVAVQVAMAIHQAELHGALSKAHELLQKTYFDTVESLCNAIEAKDNYTEGHVERTASYATEVGMNLGLPEKDLTTLRLAAMLHDIGKIGIPEQILQKPTLLEQEERDLIKQHVDIGVNILKNIEFISRAIPIIQYHHEWYGGYDGINRFGYPVGLQGNDIPLGARIVAVVDAFDAMTTSRPYRRSLSWNEAVKRLVIEKGRQFDPDIVDTFVNLLVRSYNFSPSDDIRKLIKMPPLCGIPPTGIEFTEGPVPKFS